MQRPVVDPAVPLDGFTWDPGRGLFLDAAGEYTFDGSKFTHCSTGDEYCFDTSSRLFRRLPAAGGPGEER